MSEGAVPRVCWLDQRLVDEKEARVSIDDRGFLFADGVFETALLRAGGFFRLRAYLERFAGSAATLRIPAPPTDEIDRIVREVVRANALRDAGIRITLTRGTHAPTLLVTARPPDPAWQHRARAGWRIVTARTRRPSTAAIPAQLKALGRTYALLARHEAADAGVEDVLLLDDAGNVCEGPTWNVFWRASDTLFTPALEVGVLSGVTRTALLDIAAGEGLAVREGFFPRAVLDDADEIFASMTSVGVVSIRALDGRALPAQTPLADRLRARYEVLVNDAVAADPV